MATRSSPLKGNMGNLDKFKYREIRPTWKVRRKLNNKPETDRDIRYTNGLATSALGLKLGHRNDIDQRVVDSTIDTLMKMPYELKVMVNRLTITRSFGRGKAAGRYSNRTKNIKIYWNMILSPEYLKSTVVHEVGHSICYRVEAENSTDFKEFVKLAKSLKSLNSYCEKAKKTKRMSFIQETFAELTSVKEGYDPLKEDYCEATVEKLMPLYNKLRARAIALNKAQAAIRATTQAKGKIAYKGVIQVSKGTKGKGGDKK